MSVDLTGDKPTDLYTTDQLMKYRDDLELFQKHRSQEYTTMLRKRPPLQPTSNNTNFGQNNERLQQKLDSFLDSLHSKSASCIAANAKVLADLLTQFSVTFETPVEKILEYISTSEDSSLYIENIRKHFVNN